jgi:type II secretion system (T2SS) protein K
MNRETTRSMNLCNAARRVTQMPLSRRTAARGSALLIALWALLVLSAVMLAWIQFLNQGITATREENFALQARALAHSGVQVALNPLVNPPTPLLQRSFGNDQSYSVTLTGEGGRINLKWVTEGATPSVLKDTENGHPERIALLKRYLQLRGLSFQEIEIFVDSLLDWIDTGNRPRPNGAETGPNYQPRNAMLVTLDEIKEIRGADALTSQAGWSDDFTLWSGGPAGEKIDLQWAPIQVIESIANVTDAAAQRFIDIRSGPDKQPNTIDDHQFTEDEAARILGVDKGELAKVAVVRSTTPTFRIVSVGRVGNRERKVEVVAQKGSAQPPISYWKES